MNYYELLGVSSNASDEEIKSAYKVQMKKWHPDINKDESASGMSMKINEAKEVLLNEVKRREYDESLKKETTNTYEKYSKPKTNKTYSDSTNTNTYTNDTASNYYKEEEPKKVTKWEYLKDYLKYGNYNIFKKAIVLILVLLESLLCFCLKYLVIFISFFCFIFSNIVIMFFNYLYPLLGLLALVILYILISSGVTGLITDHRRELYLVLGLVIVYILSFILPVIGRKLLSEKVFYFLYNKLDIFLFKKAVGYK